MIVLLFEGQHQVLKKRAVKRGGIKIENQMRQALQCHEAGQLHEAEQMYQSVLDIKPEHADALHLKGLVAYQTGRHETAIDLIKRAIHNDPANPLYYSNLGAALRISGDLAGAVSCYNKAIRLKPNYPEAIFNLGSTYYSMGNLEQAIASYRQAIHIKPSYMEAFVNLGVIFNDLRRYAEAFEYCQSALNIKPDCADAYNNLGNAAKGLGRIEEAISYFNKSIEIMPDCAETYSNLGNALFDAGSSDKAIACFQKAIELKPEYGEAYNNMGTAFRLQRRLKEAHLCFQKAISLKPGDPEAYHNMGNIYYDQGKYDDASEWYRKAIEIRPNMAESYIQLGITMHWQGKSDASLSCFKKAEQFDPDNPRIYMHLIHELQSRCEWKGLESLNRKVDQFTNEAIRDGRRPDEMPFLNLIRHPDIKMNYEVAKAWSSEISKRVSNYKIKSAVRFSRKKREKITIGYLSNNFRNHPTSHLVCGLFRLHNRDLFNIYCYSYGDNDNSSYRAQIQNDCDKFIDIKDMDFSEAAKQIYEDRVDILVDLAGYMKENRMDICAVRPAPIQVRWLGHAGTTGADFFDYIITDPIVSPEKFSPYFSEKFIYMDCYQINNNRQPISDVKMNKQDAGLPAERFIFCSFCTDYKIEPVMFEAWMEILQQVPAGVLWLLEGNGALEKNLRKEVQNCHVNPERLIFAERLSKEDHLRRLSLADLALDTRVVNGAATTSDALWAGVPVVSLRGEHFASRMSYSILNAIGLSELVTPNIEEYKKLAISLANNRDRLSILRNRLAENQKNKMLFDTTGYVHNLEKAFKKIWMNYLEGQDPEMIRAGE